MVLEAGRTGRMRQTYKVAGYAKLAKLWERTAEEVIEYHYEYYHSKYDGDPEMDLFDVYVDITGQKQIKKRPQMIRLLGDCMEGRINCIATQTRAYLAANSRELFYLLYLLMTLEKPIEIVTEDINYHIDTIKNEDGQREAMVAMIEEYINLNPQDYEKWEQEIHSVIKENRAKEK